MGYSRQNYYKQLKCQKRRDVQEAAVLELIRQKRKQLPQGGIRKFYYQYRSEFRKLHVGRDHVLRIARKYGMFKKKRKYYSTTKSDPNARKYPLVLKPKKEKMLAEYDQILVADITYLRTISHKYYLSLVADYNSRKIVGYALREDLSAAGPVDALKMALRHYPVKGKILHHSDQGKQYTCGDYINTFIKRKLDITMSMSRKGRPADNARMERINGILKTEFGIGKIFANYTLLKNAVKESIELYNNLRGHWRLNLKTPSEAFFELNSVNLY